MSKNAEGWIRHRGGKCPVDAGVMVDVRRCNGLIESLIDLDAENVDETWLHVGDRDDIMAYRVCEPVIEPAVVANVEAFNAQAEMAGPFIEAVQAFSALAKVPNIDGPLQWRDRITQIDATIQALTAERAELVQKLASEGFALIGRINELLTDAAQKHENIGDPKKWKVGDELEAIGDCGGFSFAGEVVKILVVRDDGGFEVATESEPDHGWFFTEKESITDLKFHSRPSA